MKALQTKYPQGAERSLIYATTGREVNSGMLPADAGCVVDNSDTAVAIYKAVILGSTFAGVSGDSLRGREMSAGRGYGTFVQRPLT